MAGAQALLYLWRFCAFWTDIISLVGVSSVNSLFKSAVRHDCACPARWRLRRRQTELRPLARLPATRIALQTQHTAPACRRPTDLLLPPAEGGLCLRYHAAAREHAYAAALTLNMAAGELPPPTSRYCDARLFHPTPACSHQLCHVRHCLNWEACRGVAVYLIPTPFPGFQPQCCADHLPSSLPEAWHSHPSWPKLAQQRMQYPRQPACLLSAPCLSCNMSHLLLLMR